MDLSGLDGLVGMLKGLQRDRDDALKTLDKIRQLLEACPRSNRI